MGALLVVGTSPLLHLKNALYVLVVAAVVIVVIVVIVLVLVSQPISARPECQPRSVCSHFPWVLTSLSPQSSIPLSLYPSILFAHALAHLRIVGIPAALPPPPPPHNIPFLLSEKGEPITTAAATTTTIHHPPSPSPSPSPSPYPSSLSTTSSSS